MGFKKFDKYPEPVDSFLDRTYWNCTKDCVLVYTSPSHKNNPFTEPIEILTIDEAKSVIEELEYLLSQSQSIKPGEDGADKMETDKIIGKEVSWNEAIEDSEFVKFEDEKPKTLVISNWRLVEVVKEFNGQKEVKIEFQSTVTELNGTPCVKTFNTVSNRLKTKLKQVLEDKDPSQKIKLSIIKLGDKFNTNYSVSIAV